MKLTIASLVLVCLTTAAFAGDVLPLPQSVNDLRPVVRQEALGAAQNIKVGIPQSRIAPAPVKDKAVIRLAPGKSQTLSLSRDAASVIVANPTTASVFLDNSRLLVIVPRAPGATGFTVLDRDGREIINQQIIVNQADDPTYVRVTRICGAAMQGSLSNSCVPSSVYYCPDNCVPVSVPQPDPDAAIPTIPPVAAMPPLPGATPPAVSGESVAVPTGVN